ncbi:c-type cytochrome [Aliifodinibius sp. S!AR15-10]|uniref:PVC-type heme-binding CxxCH protein n=1 Tax=Aliifodinibius sp. S!AR15-10 TaxID=2950437 RepID=UPI0028557B16|nr:PVC-type heme-binding CxxCH protein [Aliifodinibius sp. S!AR15-10]MDR8393612.1 c-type cytochrome [Aliifodinibius sp. S!AR15-10]
MKKTISLRLFLITIIVSVLFSCSSNNNNLIELPPGVQVLDDRLQLTVIAEDPVIGTPIGIAVDSRDRIYVLETHTHHRTSEYEGPEGDVIKVFEDNNEDGTYTSSVFAEGIQGGMLISFSPEGHLYVVTDLAVWKYYDEDEDGVSEGREKIVWLNKPTSVYSHSSLLDVNFDNNGWMYISRGTTGGAEWEAEGTDGSKISGYGFDAGNTMRARLDGSQLEQFSTGFWNATGLAFDNYGRLLGMDNDPNSRGPNRLVHHVEGGDYGFVTLFGGSGIHPYSAWNGELPGTMPYVVGVGEAPTGLLNASYANLPVDYDGQMLGAIYDESAIVRISLQDKGVSVTGETEVIIEGEAFRAQEREEDFRPVAFATDSKGNIYFTDWVIREYAVHGKGKVWKLSTKDNVETLNRREEFDPFLVNESWQKFQDVLNTNSDFDSLKENLKSSDPFMVHAAVMALSRENYQEDLIATVDDPDPDVRLGVLLALKKSNIEEVEYLAGQFLSDPDQRIRKMALIWVGSRQMTERRNDLEKALTSGEFNKDLFETYLETVKLLQPDFIAAFQNRTESNSRSLQRSLPENFISNFISDPANPAQLRMHAMRYLDDLTAYRDLLSSFLRQDEDITLRLGVIRLLYNHSDMELANQLLQIALNNENSELIRSEALFALSSQPLEKERWQDIISLLDDESENIRIEAARFLRSKASDDTVKNVFEAKLASLNDDDNDPLKQQLMLGLNQELETRPENTEVQEWQTLLAGNGDVERGRRVFFTNVAMCSTCHASEGLGGGDLGPDLTNVGQSMDKSQLISKLLLPNEQITDGYQGWFVELEDGTSRTGVQVDVQETRIRLTHTEAGGGVYFDKEDVAEYGMVDRSLMPEGLQRSLTDQEIKDLLAYLQRKF